MTAPDVTVGAEAVREAVRERRQDMVDLLVRLAQVESPSVATAAQRAVFDLLADPLAEAGLDVAHVPGTTSGGCLVARARDRGASRRAADSQLLLGHADTVWPVGTLAERPVTVADGVVRGPGTYDMKAGLVQAVTALRVLADLGLAPSVPPLLLVNSDEEVGSRDSTPLIRRLAADAVRAYVLEPSLGPGGLLKTARKGIGRFTVTVRGRAAHAGLDPTAGASAILELSHVIQTLFALNDADRGVTVNVGMVSGGISPNVVAPESGAVVDVRVPTRAAAAEVEARIAAITAVTPGVTVEIVGGIGRPPLEPTPRNQALFRAAACSAAALDLELGGGTAGGGSDGNTTSQLTATLDGLGAVGDGAHAEHEHVLVEPWLERTALLALLLLVPGDRRHADSA